MASAGTVPYERQVDESEGAAHLSTSTTSDLYPESRNTLQRRGITRLLCSCFSLTVGFLMIGGAVILLRFFVLRLSPLNTPSVVGSALLFVIALLLFLLSAICFMKFQDTAKLAAREVVQTPPPTVETPTEENA